MSDKIDKGLSVFTRRSKTVPMEEPVKIEVKPEVRPTEVEHRPVNHIEKKVIFEPLEALSQAEEGKFSFKVSQKLLNDLEDQLTAVKRKTGWKLTKKDFLCALLEAYLSGHPKLPDAKNYPELVSYLKQVLKE